MKIRLLLLVAAIATGVAFMPHKTSAQASSALTGQVTSAEEGPMEGVLVTARKTGAAFTITVVTDEKGNYHFPSSKLEPGHYAMAIRAVGYDLDGPSAVDVSGQKAVNVDLKLRKTDNLGKQLTNAEWLESIPASDGQKKTFSSCGSCHMLARPITSTHDAAEFMQVQERMSGYASNSAPEHPQMRVEARLANQQSAGEEDGFTKQMAARQKMADFLSSINLSKGTTWSYPLKTFPRPTGRATHVIITEYDLPAKTRQPHDVIVDGGMVWYTSFGEEVLGRIDPKTGKITEFTVPTLKPGAPTGDLSVRPDENGNLWLGMMYQGAIAKFDKKTEKFQTFSLPAEYNKDYTQVNQVAPMHSNVDGKVWFQDSGDYSVHRLDLATGKTTRYKPFPDPSPNIYDIMSDAQNNAYFTVFGASQIGRIDAKTGKMSFYKTPTADSAPRRGMIGFERPHVVRRVQGQ